MASTALPDLRALVESPGRLDQRAFLGRLERLGLTALPGLPASLAQPDLRERLVLMDPPDLRARRAQQVLPGQLGLREPLA